MFTLVPLIRGDLACLLEALARCPRLRALSLYTSYCRRREGGDQGLHWPFPDASAFAKLSGLTKLLIGFGTNETYTLAEVVQALVPLTGLAELTLGIPHPAVEPAALGQLKTLRSLKCTGLQRCVLEAGSLNLPNLQSLFDRCEFEDAEVLPGVDALQRLTRIQFKSGRGPRYFDPQLAQLPRLQHVEISKEEPGSSVTTWGITHTLYPVVLRGYSGSQLTWGY